MTIAQDRIRPSEVRERVNLMSPARDGRLAIGRYRGRCVALYPDGRGGSHWRYVP